MLADGEVDPALQTPAFTSRWDNYWIEGILWLVRNLDIDGIYLDGAPYERSILRRLRAALEPLVKARDSPFLLDLHASCYGNPHLPYVELYPYLDSIWFGEQCNYQGYNPDQWLAEVAGIPFGLPGEILGENRDQWQGLVFGMTCRIYPDPNRCNPRPIWAALDKMGMSRPRMVGWWEGSGCPVTTDSAHVRATVFVADQAAKGGAGRIAIAIANWHSADVSVRLQYDWGALKTLLGQNSAGFDAASTKLRAERIDGFQPAGEWAPGAALKLRRKGSGNNEGWLLSLS